MGASFGGTVKLTGESEYRKALKEITSSLKLVSSELKLTNTQFASGDNTLKQTKASYNSMKTTLEEQKTKVSDLRKALKEAETEYGSNNEKVKQFKAQLNNAETQLAQMEDATSKNNKELKEMKQGFDNAGSGALKFGDLVKANVIGDMITSGLKAVGTAVKEIASKMGELGHSVLDARGEIEQQIGGIETLFKDNSDTVVKNASNAYKTAGISATDYMKQATSFSASLLQSLNGDTAKVAEVTDMAIVDMSDNVNKIGTSMEMVQNAYQGFAKQNYTMLDNLKLGYGGTKAEMERLLADAQKVTGIKYDINNLNDVYQAIHVIQGELGITGTTAKEATETLQGSMAGMQGAWQNFLNGSGSLSQVADSVSTVVKNVTRIAKEAIPQILGDIKASLPQLLEVGKETLMTIANGIQQYLPELITVAGNIVGSLLNNLIEVLPQLIQAGVQAIAQLIQGIGQSLPELIPKALEAVTTIVEGLLDNIDLLIDSGIQLIIGLAEGLINAIPKLIEKIPVIIDKLINAITNNLPKILQAGVTLIVKLAEGLIKAIPQLVSKIPQIISSLVDGFKSFWSSIGEIGKNIVSGIWNGIKNAKDWLIGKVKEWCGNILDGIKGFFGIHSPSRVFRDEIGANLALGVGEGFSKTMKNVSQEMSNSIPTDFDINPNINANSNNQISLKSLTSAFITAIKTLDAQIIIDKDVAGKFVINSVDNGLGLIYG